jgi:hypothetical protein
MRANWKSFCLLVPALPVSGWVVGMGVAKVEESREIDDSYDRLRESESYGMQHPRDELSLLVVE